MSSDWSDTLVWFGQILLLLYFYHPIYMIIGKICLITLQSVVQVIVLNFCNSGIFRSNGKCLFGEKVYNWIVSCCWSVMGNEDCEEKSWIFMWFKLLTESLLSNESTVTTWECNELCQHLMRWSEEWKSQLFWTVFAGNSTSVMLKNHIYRMVKVK